MKIILMIILLFDFGVISANALEISPPVVPESAADLMPADTQSLEQGLEGLLENVTGQLQSSVTEACAVCACLIGIVLIVSVLQSVSKSVQMVSCIAGTTALSVLLLQDTRGMIVLGADSVVEIVEYGKLLIPVMTTALAAQGYVSSSATLYAGSAFFIAVLSGLITKLFLPLVYIYLALVTANAATGENMLKKLSDLLKGFLTWSLKLLLIVFTAYLSITGIVSGTTDAAALKATKVTISTFVPVVGGILSDASEAVLVSAGLLRNAAGIYGILALLALLLGPFVKIGMHYLMLKFSAVICSVFGCRQMTELVADYSGGMGLLLAMLGASCLMQLIVTVCFMRGVG